ncbi:hypothetical protein RSAG8_11470, partial [Rhizoctonia solani AG-8 WAC10335]
MNFILRALQFWIKRTTHLQTHSTRFDAHIHFAVGFQYQNFILFWILIIRLSSDPRDIYSRTCGLASTAHT